MILGGLAAESSFGRAEIEAMTADQARWWWNAIGAFHQFVKDQASD